MPIWTCKASKILPLNTDRDWDGAGAHSRMMDAAGIGGDSPDFAQAAKGYLLVDAEKKENRTAYSLPFADVLDGTLTCLISGCRAAASRLPQKQGVSDAESSKARAVLDAYFAKAEDGKKSRVIEPEGYFHFPLEIMTREERAKSSGGTSDEELLSIAKARAQDPSIFEEFPPHFFPAAASTNKLDSYYTRMHRSSLENFAADLSEGVSFLDSHNTRQLGIGYSLRGTPPSNTGPLKTVGDFVSLPATQRASEFIQLLRAGLVRDVSSGFYLGEDGKYVCDLCGQQMMPRSYDYTDEKRCTHWPGLSYKVGDEMKLATATIHGARLAEVSAVYDGATPGAVILKAQRMSEAGLIEPKVARLLEVQYRIQLPASHRSWAGAGLLNDDKPEEKPMADDERSPDWSLTATNREEYRAACSEAGLSPDGFPAVTVRALLTQLKGVESERDTLKEERDRLKPQAEDGATYRQAMVDETWGEYVRAGLAEKVKEEERKALWSRMPLAQVLEEKAEYTKLGDARNKGGRQTTDGAPPEPVRTSVPVHLYEV